MKRTRGRPVAMGVAALAVIVIGVLGVVLIGRGDVARWLSSATPQRPLPVRAGAMTADVAPGTIQLSEFADFLQQYTALPVIVDSQIATDPIVVVSPIHDLDAEIARALLEESGYSVTVGVLPDRTTRVIRVRKKLRE